MKALEKVFSYQGTQVRTIVKDGQPYFVAKDVCDVLDISKYRDAVANLDEDERASTVVDTPGGPQSMTVVNEPGLYSLILVASRKPEARAFKRWITHEVLPAIRQTGSYHVVPMTPTQALLKTVELLAAQEQQIKELADKVTTAHHRIDNLDAVNVIGDLQQRLNAMVRKYAHTTGSIFAKAWNDFVQHYNTAYHTNLKLLKANYELKNGRKVTIPAYLAATDHLEDGIRVADKMLNELAATG